ncbi:Zn(II)2Cys6 transcription factor [Pyrenophora seminiperda CCB06]|uniref:Zn(II)2Cys6 transcription factor n=1 Tax=Pyrenophora seminiperda CCB06 TaxID=1302712 RepID=A0A3M7M4B5_9PLEO|nr:Zn(II)2Cys6 transcription factor [Pyrenophora seminiperda CCB06]
MTALQLPACQKCKLRKVRCDRQAPKCTNCTKEGVACIIIDPESGEQYSRGFIAQLEQEESSLNERLNESRLVPTDSMTQPASTPTSDDAERRSYYVGDGSGLGFLNSILSDARWQQHRTHILNQLAARPRVHRQHLTPNSLPPRHEAEQLLDNYFTRFHIHHTFLLREEVLAIYHRIYTTSRLDKAPSAQDRFRLLMVFAISSITRHRAGLSSENLFGYFIAAGSYLGEIPLIGSVETIENLLLIARFGMYHHIGTSMWDISQLCIRQCIEWRLHVRKSKALNPLTEQHHRRIFWESYIFDRHSSGILGRPFAISELDISVPLPVDIDDEVLAESSASSTPTELSVFIHCIRLRQISSSIHTSFYTGRGKEPRFKSVGHVYTRFSRFRTELSLWRSTMPFFPSPRSLYERPEWHDFLYEKDLMLLARGAMHNLALHSTTGAITKMIVIPCYESTSRVIELYAELMDKQAITWTRSYFQIIFTAGLTIIFCLSLEVETSILENRDAVRILAMCHEILNFFKEKMPDAGSFAIVFGLLKDECVRHHINTGSTHNLNTGSDPINTALSDCTIPTSFADAALDSTHNDAYSFNTDSIDLSLGLTDNLDLMTQLEAGLGEYAWGWIPKKNNIFTPGPC